MTACLLPPRQNRTDGIDISNITSGNVVISFSRVHFEKMQDASNTFPICSSHLCASAIDLAILEPGNFVLSSFDWIHINIVVHVNTIGSQKESRQNILLNISHKNGKKAWSCVCEQGGFWT